MKFLKRILGGGSTSAAIPPESWAPVEATLPFLARLDDAARQRLRALAEELIARKEFSGAHGLVVSDAMRLSIALQACLPILELGIDAYDGWVGIIVYPGDFVIPRRVVDEDGVMHEYDEEALGEAWQAGPVVLAWFDDREDYGGANVVIHEFAHKLDMLNGEADGLPPLHSGMSTDAWLDAIDEAYDDFCDRVDDEEETEIDPYASEHPAEFFAVTSEVFFVQPELLQREYPAVFEQFKAFYRQDPLAGRG